mmetsp:Transcript_17118/g.39629  ORF Transcript_17118/g.39629 Transcript_17118/m.39629 type:complete len:233 (-) Transcript_17118:1614-2312(-)
MNSAVVLVSRRMAASKHFVVGVRALSTQSHAFHQSSSSSSSSSSQARNHPWMLAAALVGTATAGLTTQQQWTKLEEAAPTVTPKNNDKEQPKNGLQATSVAKTENALPQQVGEAYDQIKPDNKPPPRPDLPTYTMEEVSEHAEEDDMWFTFRGAVYNMTTFSQGHPGGFPVSTAREREILETCLWSGQAHIAPKHIVLLLSLCTPIATDDGGWTRFGTLLERLSPALSWTCH